MSADVNSVLTRVLSAPQFLAVAPHLARVSPPTIETIRWELFVGHLLDPAATRRTETFTASHVYLERDGATAEAPLISARYHRETNVVYVTRQILTHAFEAFEELPGVIGTRPAQKWVRELVGAIEVGSMSAGEIESQLAWLVYLAVVGISRLPITSIESPLPAFSLGELSYWPASPPLLARGDSCSDRLCALLTLADSNLAARALEFALRGLPPTDDETIVTTLSELGPERTANLLRGVFNQAALAPHTAFTDRLVRLVERLANERWFGDLRALQILSFMLRQLCRHLTAFDLSLFHNFGANYPDALFLDALLKAALRIIDHQPQIALATERRLIRRAVRGGVLLRKHYEGLRVPDAPTSMGENTRVLPAPFIRVPQDQITEQSKRRRVLFSGEPTEILFNERTRPILAQSFADLDDTRELQELGTAVFLDRPLGALKQPGEIDRTPLVSYVAFSRLMAGRRLATAKSAGWIDAIRNEALRSRLSSVTPAGLAAAQLRCVERPGVVSLTDANKAAADFIILRCTRGSLAELISRYDWQPLTARFPVLHEWLQEGADVLFIQQRDAQPGALPRFEFFRGDELQFALSARSSRSTMAAYRECAGTELLTPLALSRVRDKTGRLVEWGEPDILIQAK